MSCEPFRCRDWKGPADGREDIRRTPHPRKLEGDKVWKDADAGRGGEYVLHAYIIEDRESFRSSDTSIFDVA